MPKPKVAECVSPQPVRSWGKYRIVGGLILAFLTVSLGGIIYGDRASLAELRQAIAEADRLDPNWRLEDLEAHRVVIPDEENSALQVLSASRLLPNNWETWPVPEAGDDENAAELVRRVVQESLDDLPSPVLLNEQQIQSLRAQLREAGPALAIARKLTGMPRGRYEIKWSKGWLDSLPPHLDDVRKVRYVLATDAMLRLQEEDFDEALADCQAILNLARSLGDEPSVFSQLTRSACDAAVFRTIERTLAQGEPSAWGLVAIQKALEEEAEEPLFLFATRGERAGMDGMMEAFQRGEIKPSDIVAAFGLRVDAGFGSVLELLWTTTAVKSLRAALLRVTTQMVEIAKLPPEQQQDRCKLLLDDIEKQRQFVRMLSLSADKVSVGFLRRQAELRCGPVALAAERFRRTHDRWPESLKELVPEYIKEIPKDPFDGAPLRYRRLDEGVVIYSVGVDKTYDGGNPVDNAHKPCSEARVRLWNLEHRRQPPRPIEMPELVTRMLEEQMDKAKPRDR